MKAKRILGWIMLVGGAIYGFRQAEDLREQLVENSLAAFLFFLIGLIVILAISRILRS